MTNDDEQKTEPMSSLPPEMLEDEDETQKVLVEVISSEPLPPRPQPQQVEPTARPTVFTVENTGDHTTTFSISGRLSRQGAPAQGWPIDFGALNLQMNDMGRYLAAYHEAGDESGLEGWRRTAHQLGVYLYDGLLNVDAGLTRSLLALRRNTQPPDHLTLAFAGPRSYLGVPYELLHDGHAPLAQQHPLCRRISDVVPNYGLHLGAFIHDEIRQANQPLRVLLLSSDVRRRHDRQEVATVQVVIQDGAARARLPVEIDVMLAADTDQRAIAAKLTQCPYHLVHYTGHVYHDRLNSANSGLLLSSRRDDRLGQAIITVRELAARLKGGVTQLFYVSAYPSTQPRADHALHDSDCLGVIDTLIGTGIPYVLGFRWPVPLSHRAHFARHFYETLLAHPFAPEHAALHARRASYDQTWTAPILVAQHVYM